MATEISWGETFPVEGSAFITVASASVCVCVCVCVCLVQVCMCVIIYVDYLDVENIL